MKKYSAHLFAVFIPLIFLILKLFSTTIRLSDTNVYFYTAYQLLHGKLLYKDIFFTNFPIFPYISAVYLAISGNNIYFYYFSSALEVAATSLLIYFIVLKQLQSRILALTTQMLYLSSFLVLATSDHQSGVFLASLFATLSYLFFQRKQYVLVGTFAVLTVLTKAYFLPLAITYFAYLLLKTRPACMRFLLSACVTALLILLPFFIFARTDSINDIFIYSLTRGAGTNKWEVLQFFAYHDLLLFALLFSNLFLVKKHLLFALFSFFSILFLLFYQDIYYLYLNSLISILILSLPIYMKAANTTFGFKSFTLPIVFTLLCFLNLVLYLPTYPALQKVQNIPQLVDSIKTSHPTYIYGTNDLAPVLAFLTNTPLLDNITDTNTNIFRKRLLNATTETNHVLKNRTMVLVHGVEYPEYNLHEQALDEIVDGKKIKDKCRLTVSQPVYAEGLINRINLFRCF